MYILNLGIQDIELYSKRLAGVCAEALQNKDTYVKTMYW